MNMRCVEETRRKARQKARREALVQAARLPVRSMAWVLILLGLTLGCVKQAQVQDEAEVFLPRHPFPQWVGKLKSGESDTESVTARFGPPDEIENRARGGQIWRYKLEEIQWPEDDPNRPYISAEGETKLRPASRVDSARSWSKGATGWIDRNLFFPPPQPRPPAIRMLPATVHRLELVFEADEILSDYRYAPGRGSAQVPGSS